MLFIIYHVLVSLLPKSNLLPLIMHTLSKSTLFMMITLGLHCVSAIKAVVSLSSPIGIQGNITFTQDSYDGPTTIYAVVTGLTPGNHGFHIHEFGDLTNGCISLGPHYNPHNMTHSGPFDEVKHVGDFGNLEAGSNGIGILELSVDSVKLSGTDSVIGRGVVIHSGQDDEGRGDSPLSKTTGNSGDRWACGIIGYSST
ncbi:superoxide dismutase 2 [Pilobolus umbonatus]|nr:superoxide dismutase 2 [Pilobolus umbonatus]